MLLDDEMLHDLFFFVTFKYKHDTCTLYIHDNSCSFATELETFNMAESSSGKLCQCLGLIICLLTVNGLLFVESIEHEGTETNK